MQLVNGKIRLEKGDKVKLNDGRTGAFVKFNVWGGGLLYVNIDGEEECIFDSQLDLDSLRES